MFHFIPAQSPFVGYPRRQVYQRPDPKERYLAALAEAKSAEADYLESLEAERYYAPQRRTPFWGSYEPASYDSFNPGFSSYDRPSYRERARELALLEEEQRRLNALREQRTRLAAQRQREEEELQQFFSRRHQLQRQQEVGLKRTMAVRQQSQDFEDFIKALLGVVSNEDSKVANEKPKAEGCGSFSCKPSSSTEKAPEAPATKPSGCPARYSYGGPFSGYGCHVRPAGCARRSTPAPPTTPAKAPAASSSLKGELETRLAGEESNEIRDTIQAILASLFHPQPAAPSAAPKQETPAGKGKAKAAEESTSNTGEPTDMDIARSFSQIEDIEHSFIAIEDSFTFPSKIDFSPPASPSDSLPSRLSLSFTSNNAPIHNYQHALSQLLNKLDAVESFGNEAVRHRRKEVVDRVEGALEAVERMVEEKGEIEIRRTSVVVEKVEAPKVVEGYSVEEEEEEEVVPAPAYEEVKKEESTPALLEPLEGSVQHPLNFDNADNVNATSPAAEDVSESVATVKPLETETETQANTVNEPEDIPDAASDSDSEEELGGKSFLLSAESAQEIPSEVKKPSVTDDTEDGAGSDCSEVEA